MTDEYRAIATLSVAELVTEHARCVAAAELIEEHRAEVRAKIEEVAEQLEAVTGSAMTARADDGTALTTNPKPRPKLADAATLALQLEESGLEELRGLARERTRYSVDPADAEALHQLAADPGTSDAEVRAAVGDLVTVTVVTLLPEGILEQLEPFTGVVETSDGWRAIWVAGDLAGSTVAGVAVAAPRPAQLQVRHSAAVKKRHVEALRSTLLPRLGAGEVTP